MPDFGIFRGFNEKLFGDKLVAGQLPTELGLIGSEDASGFVGLLDDYPNAAAAYSLRLLRTAYTGDAIQVRRASDNSTQDIGFVNNQLDTTSLESFCSGTNGFVTTWYDQSGNGNDATQTTASDQPQIVSSGSVITENGKPAAEFDGSDDYFPIDSIASTFSGEDIPMARIFVISPSVNNVFQNFFAFGNSTNIRPLKQLELTSSNEYSVLYRTSDNERKSTNFSPIKLSQQLLDEYNEGTITNVYLDSVNKISNFDIDLPSIDLDLATIGALRRTTQILNFYNGTFQEFILYPSDQSSNRTGIETNINDFYSIY
jgi:hypothetical protein